MAGYLWFCALLYGVVTPLGSALWPRRRLSTLVYTAPAVAVYFLLWDLPNPFSVVVAMAMLLVALRVLDAAATFGADEGAVRHALYSHWLLTHSDERRPPAAPGEKLLRLVRGLALAAIVAGLLALGAKLELWRTCPYLDDLLTLTEAAISFIAAVDLITLAALVTGVDFFLVDGCLPSLAWSPSLRAFWAKYWNRPTAGVLRRGIYTPIGGADARARGVLAVFAACGVMHALPLLLGGPDRQLWGVVAVATMTYFLLHAIAVIIDGGLVRHVRGLGRPYFYFVMLVTAPFYPTPLGILFGFHNRPLDSYTPLVLLRWMGWWG